MGILGFTYALRDYLSVNIQWIVFSIYIIILSILIYILFFDLILNFIAKKKLKYKHNTLANKHFPEFTRNVRLFQKYVERTDTIPNVLNNLRSQPDFRYLEDFEYRCVSNL